MESFAMERFPSISRKLAVAPLSLIPAALVLTIAAASNPVYAAAAPQSALRMSCSSDDMRRHVCPVDTTGGVQMVHQKSEAKCIQNRTWGYDNRGIWVDHGCRAEFEVGAQAPPVVIGHDGGHDRDHDGRRDRDGDFRGWGES